MTASTATTMPIDTPRRGSRWRWIAAGLLLLVTLLAASAVFAPPSFFFTALLKKAVHDRTGRELTVATSRYHIREIVTVELSGVELGRPGAARGSAPFSARRITARVPLRSLLDGKPQILALDMDAPVFNLIREASGAANWHATPAALAAPMPDPAPAQALLLPPTTLHNGTIIYRDEGSTSELRLDAINATLAADDKYGGAAAKGSLTYNSEPLTFDLAIADAAAATAGRMSALALTIDSRILKARLAGQGAIGETPMFG